MPSETAAMPPEAAHALPAWLAERRLSGHVSLSDEVDSAVAFVIVEQAPLPLAVGPDVD